MYLLSFRNHVFSLSGHPVSEAEQGRLLDYSNRDNDLCFSGITQNNISSGARNFVSQNHRTTGFHCQEQMWFLSRSYWLLWNVWWGASLGAKMDVELESICGRAEIESYIYGLTMHQRWEKVTHVVVTCKSRVSTYKSQASLKLPWWESSKSSGVAVISQARQVKLLLKSQRANYKLSCPKQ